MRISALSSIVLLGALVGAAHADRKEPSAAGPAVATLGPGLGERSARPARTPRLSTGELTLAGPARPTGPAHPAGPARGDLDLTAGEITAQVAPHAPQIERCYLDRLGDSHRGGHLELALVIARDGSVLALKAAAGGLPAKTARKVEACIREIVETVRFPARRSNTAAVVPYEFHKAAAPGAGPQVSCWSPSGC
jgi:hypothetical protein